MTKARKSTRRFNDGSSAYIGSSKALTNRCEFPSEADILAAVKSLYSDQMKPVSRLLRKRLGEQATVHGVETKAYSAQALREFCLARPCFLVNSEEGGEWSVTLKSEVGSFIDWHDPEDKYPADLWSAFEAFLNEMVRDNTACLAGGRYGSACELMKRQLPFLGGFTLGQICHIIELAVQRKLLGYHNGNIVPYQQSTSMLKSKCAEEHRSINGNLDTSSGAVVDWETARNKLREILDEAMRRGSEHVPLSNVKRLFRSLYSLNLSETALGYSRLTDLLQDGRFADICRVELQERGYVVLPARGDAESVEDCRESIASNDTVPTVSESSESSDRVKFCPDEPLCFDVFEGPEDIAATPCLVFPMATPSPSPQWPVSRRSGAMNGLSLQETVVSDNYDYQLSRLIAGRDAIVARDAWETTCKALGLPLEEAVIAESQECQREDDDLTLPRARFCSSEPLCIEEAGLPDAAKTPSCLFPLPTPSPQTPYVRGWWAGAASSFAPCVPDKECLWDQYGKEVAGPLASLDHLNPSLPARQFHYDVAAQQHMRSVDVPVLRIASFVC